MLYATPNDSVINERASSGDTSKANRRDKARRMVFLQNSPIGNLPGRQFLENRSIKASGQQIGSGFSKQASGVCDGDR
jgi:hypothetical protein